MSEPARSWERVHYELRPAKQVERRMMLDTFQRLMAAGFCIPDYQYTGLGSIYFTDFIMFHRYLGIRNMLSVEHAPEIETRLRFNRPFGNVRVEIGEIGDYIPTLSRDARHILWLDYDSVLTEEIVSAVLMSAGHLSCGSILLVTVDVEPPAGRCPREWRTHYLREAGRFLGADPPPKEFAKSRLPALNARILDRAIREGLVGRQNVRFCPLFHFVYADGHQMLSIGGVLAGEEDEGRLRALDRHKLPFLRESLLDDPYRIRVPLVTRKERLYLDAAMPCRKGWKPEHFALPAAEAEEYARIYRYYPAYGEMLL